MKNLTKNLTRQPAFSAFVLSATIALAAVTPPASATEAKAVESIQATRIAFLNRHSKSVDKIEEAGRDYLDVRTKAVDNI